jgi:glycosyltransferase involved in cell wall biosynthesis
VKDADIILFDSWHRYNDVIELKKIYEDKIFVHRLDGPIKLYNNMDDNRDDIIYAMNGRIASATIFQSEYSKHNNEEMGLLIDKPFIVANNVADSRYFYRNKDITEEKDSSGRIEIISTSFSSNYKKGFDVYEYLDNNLDFDTYNYTFIGNSPVKFKNIIHKPPMNSLDLGNELRNSDLYISASLNDPCSNSLIEAKACGLPVIARNSGGHPEIVGKGSLLFNDTDNILEIINETYDNLVTLMYEITSRTPKDFIEQYIQFFTDLLNQSRNNND